MFSHLFETFGAKNAVNTNDFCALEAENHSIYNVFFASSSKNHGIYNVFVPVPCKNTAIYAVFTLLGEGRRQGRALHSEHRQIIRPGAPGPRQAVLVP